MRVDSALDTRTNTSASRQCFVIHSSILGFISTPGLEGKVGRESEAVCITISFVMYLSTNSTSSASNGHLRTEEGGRWGEEGRGRKGEYQKNGNYFLLGQKMRTKALGSRCSRLREWASCCRLWEERMDCSLFSTEHQASCLMLSICVHTCICVCLLVKHWHSYTSPSSWEHSITPEPAGYRV